MADPLVLRAPVAGLPVGPATEADVRALVTTADDADVLILRLVIDAVNEWVAELPVVVDTLLPKLRDDDGELPDDAAWSPQLELGATLLCSRLYARRNSPFGIASFNDEGAVYVQRNDPDVAQMLGLGSWRKPALG